MPFIQTIQPQYRDADEDGLIGLRGCLRWFQDIHTWYMHDIDKGKDVTICYPARTTVFASPYPDITARWSASTESTSSDSMTA